MTNPLLNLQVPIGFGFMNASWANASTLEAGQPREEFKKALQTAMDAVALRDLISTKAEIAERERVCVLEDDRRERDAGGEHQRVDPADIEPE